MTSRKATETTPMLITLPVTLERMGTLAASVLGEHTDDGGLCAICGSAWPCERVVLAASNLTVI